MRKVLRRGAEVLIAMLVVVGLLSPGTAGSNKAFAPDPDPDIKITFRGLMVFDVLRGGVQVVSLHHDAEHHMVNIRVIGPDFPDGIDWGRDLPKGVALHFDVVANPPLPPSASWPSQMPFDIKGLHPGSASDGIFRRIPNAFGPIFTFHAGTFDGKKLLDLDFVSTLSPPKLKIKVPTFVEATITLDAGQVGYLTGNGLQPLTLRKPADKDKWLIQVSNEPDYNHVCGYHFREYYRGFDHTMSGPIHPLREYNAIPSYPMAGPCDPHSQPMTLDEIVGGKQEKKAIETRPCIPLTY